MKYLFDWVYNNIMKPAHIFLRILAAVLDQVIISAVLLIILQHFFHQPLDNISLDNQLFIYFAIFSFLYFFILEAIFHKTIGKKVFNLEVKSLTGRHPSILSIFLRNLFRPIDMIGFYLLGFIFCVFSSRSQRLGDIVAHTYIAYSNN